MLVYFIVQDSPAFSETSLDVWAPVTLDIPVKPTWSVRLEAQNRWNLNSAVFDLIQVRPSIAKEFSNHVTLRGGYLWARTSPEGSQEHRPWGEFLVEKPLKHLHNTELIYRQRNELRWFTSAGSPALRSRHLVGVYIPLTKQTGVNLNNEFLVHLFSNQQVDGGFDQNRIHVGIEHEWNQTIRSEVAYRWIVFDEASQSAPGQRHVIYAQLNVSLPQAKNDHHP